MPELWTDEEYAETDALYATAAKREVDGEEVTAEELVEAAEQLTGRTSAAVRKHLDNLSAAREALGLPMVDALGKPSPSVPNKLMDWMRQHHLHDATKPDGIAPVPEDEAEDELDGELAEAPVEDAVDAHVEPVPPVSEAAAFSPQNDAPPPPAPEETPQTVSYDETSPMVWLGLLVGVLVVVAAVLIYFLA